VEAELLDHVNLLVPEVQAPRTVLGAEHLTEAHAFAGT
jgi:hypothetical protein